MLFITGIIQLDVDCNIELLKPSNFTVVELIKIKGKQIKENNDVNNKYNNNEQINSTIKIMPPAPLCDGGIINIRVAFCR